MMRFPIREFYWNRELKTLSISSKRFNGYAESTMEIVGDTKTVTFRYVKTFYDRHLYHPIDDAIPLQVEIIFE